MGTQSHKLGDWLLELGYIDEAGLAKALELQQRTGERLGEILITHGLLRSLELQQAIAHQRELPFVNLITDPPDAALLRYEDCADYMAHGVMPWRTENGVTQLACLDITTEARLWAQEKYGDAFRWVITSRFDLLWSINDQFAERLNEHSRLALWKLSPERSAREIFHPKQRSALISFFLLLALLAIWAPATSLLWFVGLMNLFYLFAILLKAFLFLHGSVVNLAKRNKAEAALETRNNKLPTYTILIPMYRERESVPRMLDAMRALDYPRSKLDIKLITEADDEETIQAIIAAKPEAMFELIRVPPSLPRTKPKACNYALAFARGEYVTIYDAEDLPEPQQLRKAAARFAELQTHVACLQARLNYYNRHETWLTRLFSLEYASLFDYMLPGLQSLGIPIPLGGTSNHMHISTLRRLGAWDPYNVTEDADLGIRLAMSGYETRVLDSITLEEAPMSLGPWLRQRSRWIKGYMQTWLVFMRDWAALYRQFEPLGFWGFQFFIGGPCLVFLVAPLLWLLSLLYVLGAVSLEYFPPWMFSLSILVLCIGLASHWAYGLGIIAHQRWKGMIISALAFPFYWILHSLASFKALWQLLTRPHFWEKTSHGLTRTSREQMHEAFRQFS